MVTLFTGTDRPLREEFARWRMGGWHVLFNNTRGAMKEGRAYLL